MSRKTDKSNKSDKSITYIHDFLGNTPNNKRFFWSLLNLSLLCIMTFGMILDTNHYGCMIEQVTNVTSCTFEKIDSTNFTNSTNFIIYPSKFPDKTYHVNESYLANVDVTQNYTCYWDKRNVPKLTYTCFDLPIIIGPMIGCISSIILGAAILICVK